LRIKPIDAIDSMPGFSWSEVQDRRTRSDLLGFLNELMIAIDSFRSASPAPPDDVREASPAHGDEAIGSLAHI
jgi:hypothetical protein